MGTNQVLASFLIVSPILFRYRYQGNALRFTLQFLEIIAFNYVGKGMPIGAVVFDGNANVGKPNVKFMVLKPLVLRIRLHLGSVVLNYRAIVYGFDICHHVDSWDYGI